MTRNVYLSRIKQHGTFLNLLIRSISFNDDLFDKVCGATSSSWFETHETILQKRIS